MEIMHAGTAGIDVGVSEHWVAVSPERDREPVRRFGRCRHSVLRHASR
jgi:hypothetical protein